MPKVKITKDTTLGELVKQYGPNATLVIPLGEFDMVYRSPVPLTIIVPDRAKADRYLDKLVPKRKRP